MRRRNEGWMSLCRDDWLPLALGYIQPDLVSRWYRKDGTYTHFSDRICKGTHGLYAETCIEKLLGALRVCLISAFQQLHDEGNRNLAL